jgi:hypothetical protein
MFLIRAIQVLGGGFAVCMVLFMVFGPTFSAWIVRTTGGITVLQWLTPVLFFTAAFVGLLDVIASRQATRKLTKTTLFYLGATGLVLWTILGLAVSPLFSQALIAANTDLMPFIIRWGPILAILSMIAVSRDSFMLTKRNGHHGHFNSDAVAAQ